MTRGTKKRGTIRLVDQQKRKTLPAIPHKKTFEDIVREVKEDDLVRGESVSGSIKQVKKVKRRLEERGKKISRANDKSEEIAAKANDFASLARQLQEREKSSWI